MTDIQARFFDQINALGTGNRAALRREAGNMLQQADGRAITVFYRCVPSGVKTWEEDRWFAVACLRCLWDAGNETGKPMEQLIADLLRREELSDSTRHRIEILLDTDWDADGYFLAKLARLVKLIRQKSDRANIDFAVLLEDLLRWNGETQAIQRKWARTVFAQNNDTEKEEKELS